MRKFQAKYITASGDAVDGRTRVYGVIVAGIFFEGGSAA
jgi:hypothetical protein